MKQRLIVMNGQRLLENEVSAGKWVNEKVEKAHGVKPGIYNLYSAMNADKAKEYPGIILHTDKSSVYQQVAGRIVSHNRADFDKTPDVGQTKSISYDKTGKTVVTEAVLIKQGLSR